MDIQEEIRKIHLRNKSVEADKAWETSFFRKFLIAMFTYLLAFSFMIIAGLEKPWLGACVPTLGYILSTLSIPIIKQWWIKKFYES